MSPPLAEILSFAEGNDVLTFERYSIGGEMKLNMFARISGGRLGSWSLWVANRNPRTVSLNSAGKSLCVEGDQLPSFTLSSSANGVP